MKNGFNVENFQRTCDDMALQYALIYMQTNALLKEYFDYKGTQPSLPINHHDLAEWIGLKIIEGDLNYFRSTKYSDMLSELQKNKDEQYCINLDEAASYPDSHYALCYEIAAYLCGLQEDAASSSYVTSIIRCGENNFLIEIMTAFLLLPPDLIFKEIDNYIQQNNSLRRIEMDEWMCQLFANNAIPKSQTETSFAYIRNLFSYLSRPSGKRKLKEAFQRSIYHYDEELSKKFEDILNREDIFPKYFLC